MIKSVSQSRSHKSALVVAALLLGIGTTASCAEPATTNKAANSNSTVKSAAGVSATIPKDTEQKIRATLKQAGIKKPILSITPSQLPSMYQVTLDGLAPLHITADARYVLQGELSPNPSPKAATPPKEPASQTQAGMPISNALRQSMLKNMSLLKNMTADIPLYHTAVPGVIWGMTFGGEPFVTNTEASVFTDGEIAVIANGQFTGIDGEFEAAKNRHIFSQLDEDELIIYPATTAEKAVVYVATDINCPYCRQLHGNMAELNAQGVTVKVIGYPVYEESPEQMRQIWCESDKQARRKALDSAMAGQVVPSTCSSAQDKSNPLQDNKKKATALAVFATPLIIREDGVMYGGSFESPEFLEFLEVN